MATCNGHIAKIYNPRDIDPERALVGAVIHTAIADALDHKKPARARLARRWLETDGLYLAQLAGVDHEIQRRVRMMPALELENG